MASHQLELKITQKPGTQVLKEEDLTLVYEQLSHAGRKRAREVNLLLVDSPQPLVDPQSPTPVPTPTPGEKVIDDTQHDKHEIEDKDNSTDSGASQQNGTSTDAVDDHPNAVVPSGHNYQN